MPTLLNNIQTAHSLSDDQLGLITAVLDFGLGRFDKAEAEVSLVLVDNDYIQELNLEYRGIDQPTDVLSFAMEEGEEMVVLADPEDGEPMPELLGDIYISVERAREQAESYGHTFERELSYLAVHGLLHLMGFDHQNPEDTTLMRAEEEKVLQEFMLERS